MHDDAMGRFAALFFAGIILMAIGAVNLLLRQAASARAALGFGVLVIVLLLAATVGGAWSALQTVLLVLPVVVPLFVLGTEWGRRAVRRMLKGPGRPPMAWGTCMAIGAAASVLAAVRYETEDIAAVDRSMSELEKLVQCAGDVSVVAQTATTDKGRPIVMFDSLNPRSAGELQSVEDAYFRLSGRVGDVIRRQPSDDRSNCHGWVFAGARYRIHGADVEHILNENGYLVVSDPKPDDLAIYRKDGWIIHTAIVRYVSPDLPPLVEGKWDATGVYLHPVGETPYGRLISYHRSPRRGHLLVGLDK